MIGYGMGIYKKEKNWRKHVVSQAITMLKISLKMDHEPRANLREDITFHNTVESFLHDVIQIMEEMFQGEYDGRHNQFSWKSSNRISLRLAPFYVELGGFHRLFFDALNSRFSYMGTIDTLYYDQEDPDGGPFYEYARYGDTQRIHVTAYQDVYNIYVGLCLVLGDNKRPSTWNHRGICPSLIPLGPNSLE